MPKRTSEHIVETESTSILRGLIVNEAMFRELSEKDYGIDGVIEFFNSDGSLLGDDVLVQIKGSRNVTLRNGFVKTPSISTETVKYWTLKKQSVFILLVDVSAGVVYFEDVKSLARYSSEKINTQKSITFSISKDQVINSKDLSVFRDAVFIADKFEESKSELSQLIFNFKDIYKKLIEISGRDCFMVINKNDPRIALLNGISTSLRLCWYFFGVRAQVHDFSHFMRLTYDAWSHECVEMHITDTADYLKKQFHLLMLAVIATKDVYLIFWEENEKVFTRLNNSEDFDLMQSIAKGEIGLDEIHRLKDSFG